MHIVGAPLFSRRMRSHKSTSKESIYIFEFFLKNGRVWKTGCAVKKVFALLFLSQIQSFHR